MKKKSIKLYILIDYSEILIIAGEMNELSNFKLINKIILPITETSGNKIFDFEKVADLIKKNILLIEQQINFTFKDLIIIIDNFDITFLNLTGFKKLNGTQISKENITYIINSLKINVDQFENKKKILHIFNSKYCLDKKNIDNLPIGLFGDFYSHELSFNLINKNDYKNLQIIFDNCNLKIEKILLESYVKGAFISNTYPQNDTFFFIQINTNKSKIFFIENGAIKYEQKFQFGTDIILNDISKVTSLDLNNIKKFLNKNTSLEKILNSDLVEKEYFDSKPYRKIKKKLIADIAEARIKEIIDLIFYKNINFDKTKKEIKKIFLEINLENKTHCIKQMFSKCFLEENKIELKNIEKPDIEEIIGTANNIVQFGWKKEAIPITKKPKSLITRFFRAIFD